MRKPGQPPCRRPGQGCKWRTSCHKNSVFGRAKPGAAVVLNPFCELCFEQTAPEQHAHSTPSRNAPMADHEPCPTVHDLADLVHGAVPPPETHRLGQHVLTCPGCVDTLSGMAGGDTLIQQLRDQQQAAPGTEVDRMIDN